MSMRWSEKRSWSSVQLRDPLRQSVNQQGVEMLEIHRQNEDVPSIRVRQSEQINMSCMIPRIGGVTRRDECSEQSAKTCRRSSTGRARMDLCSSGGPDVSS